MFQMQKNYPVSVAETAPFQQQAKSLLAETEIAEVIGHVAFCPEQGEVVSDSGGVRMLDWSGKELDGKDDLLILYYFHDLNMPVYLLAVCPKCQF